MTKVLPGHRLSPPSIPPQSADDMDQVARNILVVDDIVDDLLMFEDCIEEMGHVPHLALTPQDAREILQKKKPELIVWNTDVPKSWDEIKAFFKNRAWKHLPMIAIVGPNNDRAAESALKLGCIGLMRKPIAEGVIAEVLEQGLRPGNSIPAYTYQLTLDIPLFTGGRISAERARAGLEEKKIVQGKQDLGNQIALQLQTAIAELNSARAEVDVANLGVKLAEEEVGQARDRFVAGVANNIEVINAQDELARANDNQIAALYRYNQARANVAHAAGQFENLYAK